MVFGWGKGGGGCLFIILMVKPTVSNSLNNGYTTVVLRYFGEFVNLVLQFVDFYQMSKLIP